MDSRTSTFLTTSALVLALALALVGPAQAMVVGDGDGNGQAAVVLPNDRDGQLGVGGIESQSASAPDWFERAAQRGQQSGASVRPDDRGGARGAGAFSEPQLVSPTVSTADDGFDWQTIGFGAGAFLLALCAAAIAAMTLGSRRTPAH